MTGPLSIERLSVPRGGLPAVVDLSYDVAHPGWIGIIGANGSGKTTLLRAVAGRLPVRAGRILIDGVDLSHDRVARAERVGFAVEAGMLPGELTPREVFAISARADKAADEPCLRRLRAALNLEPFIDRKCNTLSAGMGQRVALLTAFLDLPSIVILDEPFNWLDPLTAYDVKLALGELVAARQLTLVTALHDISTLTGYCERGLLMSAGRVALRMEQDDLRAGLSDPVAFEAAMVERLRASQ